MDTFAGCRCRRKVLWTTNLCHATGQSGKFGTDDQKGPGEDGGATAA